MNRFVLIFTILFCTLSKVCLHAQIRTSFPLYSVNKVIYTDNQDRNTDDMYGGYAKDISLCLSSNGEYYIRVSQSYVTNGTLKLITPKTSGNKLILKFFLSNKKEEAVSALKSMISSLQALSKNEHIEIKDFKGKSFIFSAVKSNGDFFVVDEDIPLQNIDGKDWDGFAFVWNIHFLQNAVRDSDSWKG